MEELELIKEMHMIMKTAVDSGDWAVDGACDPAAILACAEDFMERNGAVVNSVTGEYMFGL